MIQKIEEISNQEIHYRLQQTRKKKKIRNQLAKRRKLKSPRCLQQEK